MSTYDEDPNDPNARPEGDAPEDASPEDLQDKRYPCAPGYRISEGKVARLHISRVLATGKPLQITAQGCPIRVTWAEIKRVCGGGTYTVRPQGHNNQFLGSTTETMVGRPVSAEEIVWPADLTVGDGIVDTPPVAAAPAAEAQEIALDRRTREQREWDLRMQREQKQWEEDRDRRRALDEERAQQSRQLHELAVQKITAEITAKTAEFTARSTVELKKAELEGQLALEKLRAENKNSGARDVTDRLISFVETAGEKLLDKHPEKVAKVIAEVSGTKLEENARAAVKEQAKVVSEELAGDMAEEVVRRAAANPRALYQELVREVLRNPEQAREFLDLLKAAAAEQ